MKIELNLPLLIGPHKSPSFDICIPEMHPLTLSVDPETGRLQQLSNTLTENILSDIYSQGIEMGVTNDDTDFGRPYVNDFIKYFTRHSTGAGTVLEIGAGTGYLSKLISNLGYTTTLIEPGIGYSDKWEKYNLEVINDFFPHPALEGKKYDYIILYNVIEHMDALEEFCLALRGVAKSSTRIIIAVPDCEKELVQGDASILVHEHMSFFTMDSLEVTFENLGFAIKTEKSEFGRSIFACITLNTSFEKSFDVKEKRTRSSHISKKYLALVQENIYKVKHYLEQVDRKAQLGIYCPARMLNYLSVGEKYKFLDDSPVLEGKYYPPFKSKITPVRKSSLKECKHIIIGSQTFENVMINRIIKNSENPIEIHRLSQILGA